MGDVAGWDESASKLGSHVTNMLTSIALAKTADNEALVLNLRKGLLVPFP